MKYNPLISVVIPTFNRQKTILYCLDSVLAQTYNNLEVIVIDDCSTDNTVSIINKHADPRVRCIIMEKNSGAQAARNRGVREARGEWIAFQDSDDEWAPQKLEKQVVALDAVKYDPNVVVHSNAYRFDNRKRRKDIWMLPTIEGDNQYAALLRRPGPLYQTMLLSRTALETIGLLDEKVQAHQEWDTSIRLARCCRFIHLREPLLIYHVGDGSAISDDGVKNVEGWHYIICKNEDDIRELCGAEAWHKLVIELLRKCLNFGLLNHYDLYFTNLCVSQFDSLRTVYLMFCRRLHLKADNIALRVATGICRFVLDNRKVK